MKAFEYAAPGTVEIALKALDGPNATPMGGGVDLLGRMKDLQASPDRVVYLKDIKGYGGIEGTAATGLTIKAGTLLAAIVEHPEVIAGYPALAEVVRHVATTQIRNMATLGGNLLQRPKDWYFRQGFGMLPMKDGKNLLREGDNRYAAIFLNDGDALFVSPSCPAVPLVALGAKVTIQGPKGERTIPIEGLYQVPKKLGDSEHTIAPGELITRISLPPAKGKSGSYEIRHKQSHDWPLAIASIDLMMDGEAIADSRVVLYGVAPIPYRSAPAEAALKGKALSRDTAEAAGKAAVEGAKTLSMNAYKLPLVVTAVKRALLTIKGDRYWEEA